MSNLQTGGGSLQIATDCLRLRFAVCRQPTDSTDRADIDVDSFSAFPFRAARNRYETYGISMFFVRMLLRGYEATRPSVDWQGQSADCPQTATD